MKNLFALSVSLLLGCTVYAQASSAVEDEYRGNLTSTQCKSIYTDLMLKHEKNADEGTFTLKQMCNGVVTGEMTDGTWTVLRGDATNKNATVVELDKSGWHFLRLKNGDLKQLDKELHIVKDGEKYILKKQAKK